MTEKKKPHIIVIGNEKGGAGKTTTTVHLKFPRSMLM